MIRSRIALGIALWLATASPALAWDPDADPPPAADPPDEAVPAGLYLVTETYAGDVVTRDGPLTTYVTDTVHQITGSYARVLGSVGTGAASAFDGSAFNGRAALSDGRAVAGTYYENFVRTAAGFVPVSVVFFQDDSELARLAAAPTVTPTPAATSAPRASEPNPLPAPTPAPATARVTPLVEPADPPAVPPPAPIAPLPDRDLEVLRGRRIGIDLSGPQVAGWRFIAGPAVLLGPPSGGSADVFVARWDALAAPGSAWVCTFAISYRDGAVRTLTVRVTVRAPGLVG